MREYLVTITYCTEWNYLTPAASLADTLTDRFPTDETGITVIIDEGTDGIFDVKLTDKYGNSLGITDSHTGEPWWHLQTSSMVYSKYLENGQFPTNEEVINRIKSVMEDIALSEKRDQDTRAKKNRPPIGTIRIGEAVVKTKKEFL